MTGIPLTEVTATHEDDFREHLGMTRTRTFRGKEPDSFVHAYSANKKALPKDSADTFHGIMAYHGYKEKRTKDPHQIEYEGTDKHRTHRFTASLSPKGELSGIQHHERFKAMNEENKGPRVKKLREIVPKDVKPTFYPDDFPDQWAPEPTNRKKFLDLHKIKSWSDRNGNPDGFATEKSPGKKELGPDAGTKDPMRKVSEGALDEISSKVLKSYSRKANTSMERAARKGDAEEDKAMSTDGDKYPEKQARHLHSARAHFKTYRKRRKGIDRAKERLTKEGVEESWERGQDIALAAANPVTEADLEELSEHLGPDAEAGDYIDDFVHSDNPKFAGKSKKERIKMALGAYYGKNRA